MGRLRRDSLRDLVAGHGCFGGSREVNGVEGPSLDLDSREATLVGYMSKVEA
jgi:hypothetical protein